MNSHPSPAPGPGAALRAATGPTNHPKPSAVTRVLRAVSRLGLRLVVAGLLGAQAVAACVSITCPPDVILPCTGPAGAIAHYTPTASSTCDAPITVTCHPPSGTVFPIGTNSVLCTVTDTRGNVARCEFRVIVTNAPPVLTCPTGVTLVASNHCLAPLPVLTVAVEERCTPPQLLTISQSPPAGTELPPGEHPVTVTVSEGNHVEASCTILVKVVDGQGPAITTPPALTAWCAPEGAKVEFTASATDSCDGPVEVTCTPPSGSLFPPGTTLVTCQAKDSAGNVSTKTFPVTVQAASATMSWVAGSKDQFALPAEPSQKSACLLGATAGLSLGAQFDQTFPGRWLGHSFLNLPGLIDSATLRLRLKPHSSAASNDVIRVGLSACSPAPGSPWILEKTIAALPECAGQWTTNPPVIVTLDLTPLLPALNLAALQRLDVLVGDDTVVDWMELRVGTCDLAGFAGGAPYQLRRGTATHGPDERLVFTPESPRTPFLARLHTGAADGVELQLDETLRPSRPRLEDASCTSAASLAGTQLDWNPDATPLCSVRFDSTPGADFVTAELTQPPAISGGRAVEIWSNGALVSRHFLTDGTLPSGVILPASACLFSIGFAPGDFFIALQEPTPISFLPGHNHVSGQKDTPVHGDFVRLIFNLPAVPASPDEPEIRFVPNTTLDLQGPRLEVHRLRWLRLGNVFTFPRPGHLSIGEDVEFRPFDRDEAPDTTCLEAPVMSTDAPATGDNSGPGTGDSSAPLEIALAEWFTAPGLAPGAALDIAAGAVFGTEPPLDAGIGRLRLELVSLEPPRVRVRVNYQELFLKTDLAVSGAGLASLDLPGHEELELDGLPDFVRLAIVDNQARFTLRITSPTGIAARANGDSIGLITEARFAPLDAPAGLHQAPYRFCVTRSQAWANVPLTFLDGTPRPVSNRISPSVPGPRPELASCLVVDAPTAVVRFTPNPEGVPVDFTVLARSLCGFPAKVECHPRPGSVFPPGITFVHGLATDSVGHSLRFRFPVVVHPGEPRLGIQPRSTDGSVAVDWPGAFAGWHLEGSNTLQPDAWTDLGPDSQEVAIPGDPAPGRRRLLPAGAPFEFFRLRAP